MRPSGRPAALGLLVAALLWGGCEPSCKQACRQLLACDDVETPRVTLDDCVSSCEVQQEVYERWDDTQLREGLAEAKRCVMEESCEDVADGVCYDEDLYIW